MGISNMDFRVTDKPTLSLDLNVCSQKVRLDSFIHMPEPLGHVCQEARFWEHWIFMKLTIWILFQKTS